MKSPVSDAGRLARARGGRHFTWTLLHIVWRRSDRRLSLSGDRRSPSPLPAALLALAFLGACGRAPGTPAIDPAAPAPPRVVATTTLVGEVARRVGGADLPLTVLVPPGGDPHAFEPSPEDAADLAGADLIFANGLGYEQFLDPLLTSLGASERLVLLSDGIVPLAAGGQVAGAAGNAGAGDAGSESTPAGPPDPHVWFDPRSLIQWTENAAAALAAADPDHAAEYAARAAAYRAELEALDAWIRSRWATVPPERRRIVADHAVFGYFCAAYGCEQVGAIIPGFSSLAEPSAASLSRLSDAIGQLGVPAIFVGTAVDPDLATRLAEDTGTRLVRVHTESLTDAAGPAPTYDAFMRANVEALVEGLVGEPSPEDGDGS